MKKITSWLNNTLSLNDKPLLKQKVLLITILPFSLAIILWYPVFFGPYKFDFFNVEAQKKFLELSKIELWLIASIPIIAAFISTAHRTVQTSHQIELTQKKNNQDSYYTHIKYITDSILSRDITIKYSIINAGGYKLFLDGINTPGELDLISTVVKCSSPKKLYSKKFPMSSVFDGASINSTNVIESEMKEIFYSRAKNILAALELISIDFPNENIIDKINSHDFVRSIEKVNTGSHNFIMKGVYLMLSEMLKVLNSDYLAGLSVNFTYFLERFKLEDFVIISSHVLDFIKSLLDEISSLDEELETIINAANKMILRYCGHLNMIASQRSLQNSVSNP